MTAHSINRWKEEVVATAEEAMEPREGGTTGERRDVGGESEWGEPLGPGHRDK